MSRRFSVLLLAFVVSSSAAYAQDVAPNKGRLRGFVFRGNGLPIPGTRVIISGATVASTDEEGMFLVELAAEPVSLTFAPPEGNELETERPVPIFAGQETELIITIPESGAPAFDVEAPERALETIAEADAPRGVVRGLVRSEQKNEPIAGARVFVRGSRNDARTDADGRFELELPAGSRELTIIHPSYSTTTAPVAVVEGQTADVDIQLAEKSVQLAEVVITAPRIEGTALEVLKERQESASVADVLGADQISKAGDSDAAGALSRVTGITVVGGRYIYVRGLGERYSSTQLNGSNLPSPDPERRVVPLDLFPASAIAGITVQKTYSPNLPGEFGGGMVQIRTMEIPDELSLSAGISSRIVSSSTLEEGLIYRGGGTDFLGFGSGSRALPKEFQELAGKQLIRTGDRFNPGLTSAQIESLGEQLDPVWGGTPAKLPLDFGLGLEAGGKFDLFGARAGALVSVDYSSSWFLQRQQFTNRALVGDGTLAVARAIEIRETQNEIGVSGLGSFAIDLSEEHQLRLTSGVFRISLDRAQLSSGIDDDVGGGVETHVLDWSERMVNTNQLRGTHVLVPELELRLEWRYQFSLASSEQPNRRALTYIDQAGQWLVSNDGNERFYSSLLDRGHEAGFDLFLPLAIFGEVKSTFSGGFSADIRNREVDVRRYFFRRSSADPRSAELRPLRPNDLFNQDTIAPGLFELEETTRGDDNYLGRQSVFAGYGMVDLGLSESISVLFGARLEAAVQNIDTQGAIADPAINMVAAELARTDLLPAVTATWAFIQDMQLRAAFAQTVNRPNFRELSPGAFIDQTRALEYRGNPELERAVIYHGDLRWEWYPSPGESLSVAAFGKYIRDPIENALDSGANLVARPINTEQATNFGVEVEGRKNFGFLGEFAEDLYVAGNLTLVSSNVSLGDAAGALTSKERALQGQSPYAINAQLGYENFDWGFSGTLLFNVFGPRISNVGLQGVPDIFEQPQPTLDLVLKQTWERYALSLKLQNIFDPAVRFAQREPSTGELLDRERYQRGRRLSLSLTVDLD